jgi:hypothetical protein
MINNKKPGLFDLITLVGKMRIGSVILAFFTVVAIGHKFFHINRAQKYELFLRVQDSN